MYRCRRSVAKLSTVGGAGRDDEGGLQGDPASQLIQLLGSISIGNSNAFTGLMQLNLHRRAARFQPASLAS
jgi:hypothetical protein